MDSLYDTGLTLLEQFNSIVHSGFVFVFGPWAGLAEIVFVLVVLIKWVWKAKWI